MGIKNLLSNESQVSLKSLFLLVVMMIVATSNSFGQIKKETIGGLTYILESATKSATVMPSSSDKYAGIISVPEKVKSSDGVEYTVTTLGDGAFSGCKSLASITIPSTVTSLGYQCFQYCSSLRDIKIPSSVTSLGGGCFSYCSSLVSITLPSSVTSLEWDCFFGCTSLAEIQVPSSVTSIGNSCFEDCSSLTSITLPSSVTSLGQECFRDCSSLTNITIPSSVTSLEHGCFEDCKSLKNITIPSSVTSLGMYCFFGCKSLKNITLPNSVISLGDDCFLNCTSLAEIQIPSSVTKLNNRCFYNCTSLAKITIPSSVTSLGECCFDRCKSLKKITIPSSVTRMGICFGDSSYVEEAIFKGRIPNEETIYWGLPTSCIIYVPKVYLQEYKDLLGYSYIYALEDDGEEEPGKCETPTIAYSDGKLRFVSSTPNAEYHYSLTTMDTASDVYTKEGIINLSAAYDIKAYATADGYMVSDVATATLYWLEKSEDNPSSNIIQAKTRGIVATGQDGIVRISGLDDGEEVGFYTTDGKLIATAKAIGGVVSQALNEYNDYIVIAKIAGQSIKIATR